MPLLDPMPTSPAPGGRARGGRWCGAWAGFTVHSVLSWPQGAGCGDGCGAGGLAEPSPWGLRPWADPLRAGEVGASPSQWPSWLLRLWGPGGGSGLAWTRGAKPRLLSVCVRAAGLALPVSPLGGRCAPRLATPRCSPPPYWAAAGCQPGGRLPDPTQPPDSGRCVHRRVPPAPLPVRSFRTSCPAEGS